MQPNNKTEIGVLNGFRCVCILLVANYHFWQQTWLSQSCEVFGTSISWDYITRSSYVFVDALMLLSAFLLFLPYARTMGSDCPVEPVTVFYKKRVRRIVPSYLFCVLILFFCVALPQNAYVGRSAAKDFLSHLTFTFLFWRETYITTPLNAALWSIGVEMQFYLFFPFLARAVRKKPYFTLLGMGCVGLLYRYLVCRFAGDTAMWLNQFPAFLDVFALGMAGAILWCKLQPMLKEGKAGSIGVKLSAVVLSAACIYGLGRLLALQSTNGCIGQNELRLSQMTLRLPLAVVFLLLILSMSFWPKGISKLMDNRLTRFGAGISMNLYIWHQVLCVMMRKAWFADADALHTTLTQQVCLTVLSWSVSLLAAMAVTYGIEKPAAKWITRFFLKKEERL